MSGSSRLFVFVLYVSEAVIKPSALAPRALPAIALPISLIVA